MGRGKIEIKRIENTTNRQVTFSKRRNGIIKKAAEITVLCDAKVSVVIFGNNGKMYSYHSPSSSVEDILKAYQDNKHDIILWDAKHENLKHEIARIKKENDDMQIELRHLKGEDIASLQHPELARLEDALDNGLRCIKDKQMEIYDMCKKNINMVEEEHDQLLYIMNKQQNEMMDGNLREMEGGARPNPPERDFPYQQQIPFGFRVQPMQPNLHDDRV